MPGKKRPVTGGYKTLHKRLIYTTKLGANIKLRYKYQGAILDEISSGI